MIRLKLTAICLLLLPGVISAQTGSEVLPFLYDREVVSKPNLATPPEAIETGLGGIVSVPVTVDAAGTVVAVGEATGPGSVCRQVTRADVAAIRAAAAEAAKLARFVPIKAGEPELSRSWVRFEFQSSGKEEVYSATAVPPDTKPSEPEKSSKDKTKITVKGDRDYSAATAPPPDYVGPVNTTGTASAGSAGPDKFTVVGDRNDGTFSSSSPGYIDTGKRISGGVLNGKALSLPKPPYPPAARAVRASGAVSIQVLIDTNGEVFSAQTVSGHPLLRPAAAIAACGARFSPTLLQGQPVKVSGIITYNFVP
ncbi:MAG: energy transducer TonB [Pyrinomonadaceae bacterium]